LSKGNGGDDDVLSDLALAWVLDLAESKDGFCGDQEADPVRLVHQQEQHDQKSLEPADVLASLCQPCDVVVADLIGEAPGNLGNQALRYWIP
jgi:hypothetical protein